MGKRKGGNIIGEQLVKRYKERVVESRFQSLMPNERVTSVNDIPIRILREIFFCLNNRRVNGSSSSSIKNYKKVAWKWLTKVWLTSEKTSSSDLQIGRILLSRVTIDEWKRLGVDFVRKVATHHHHESTEIGTEEEGLVPVNFIPEEDVPESPDGSDEEVEENDPYSDTDAHAGSNVADILFGDEQEAELKAELDAEVEAELESELQASIVSDSDDDDGGLTATTGITERDDDEVPDHLRWTLTQILKNFNTLPGVKVANEGWTTVLKDIHKHKPKCETEEDVKKLPERIKLFFKKLPETGRGMTYLGKTSYDHILFRDLLEYEEEEDVFVDSPNTEDFDRWHYEEIVPEPVLEDDEKTESDDDEPLPANEHDDADDEGSEKGDAELEGFFLEKDIDNDLKRDMDKHDDIDGWFGQQTVYFGIENVLMGRNPGILDVQGYQNVLKAMALLEPTSLSKEIVDKLWEMKTKKPFGHHEFQTKEEEKPSTEGRREEPEFCIDLFIDGVQIFKSSNKSSCTPIMGRVIAIDREYIPSRRSKPFLIGLYHGIGKPTRRAFFSDLCKELRFLHPSTIFDKSKYHRSITVTVRAIIGDAIERAWIRGCKQCTGYYSCERCHIKGQKIKEKSVPSGSVDEGGEPVNKILRFGAVKFMPFKPTKKNKVPPKNRTNECWNDYWKPEPGEKDVEGMSHRTQFCPLTEIPGFPPVTGFPLEEMHLADGGAVPDSVTVLLDMQPKQDRKWFEEQKKLKIKRLANPFAKPRQTRTTQRSISRVRQEKWSHRIRRLRMECTPFEFPRKCRSLRDFTFWKMSETRQFFMYYFPALASMDKSFDNDKRKLGLKLVRALSLVSGNVLERPSSPDLAQSRGLFKDFYYGITDLKPDVGSYKLHAMCMHLVDDVINFGCRTTALSSYPYENEIRFVSRWNFNGRNVPKQIANRFLLRYLNRQPKPGDNENFSQYMEKVKRNGNRLTFPPFFVHEFDAAKEIVKCESVRISTKFPNNIVRIQKFFKGCGARPLTHNICVVQSIFPDRETSNLKVAVRAFTTVVDDFKDPYKSSLIGSFQCRNGLLPTTEVFDFTDIDCKFFPFPHRMCVPFDVMLDEEGRQHYVMMKIQHTDLY